MLRFLKWLISAAAVPAAATLCRSALNPQVAPLLQDLDNGAFSARPRSQAGIVFAITLLLLVAHPHDPCFDQLAGRRMPHKPAHPAARPAAHLVLPPSAGRWSMTARTPPGPATWKSCARCRS